MITTFKALAIAVSLSSGILVATNPASAGAYSPFYPDEFRSPSAPSPSVGVGSGIPPQYRLSD